jgi:hypothetical protein
MLQIGDRVRVIEVDDPSYDCVGIIEAIQEKRVILYTVVFFDKETGPYRDMYLREELHSLDDVEL